MIPKVPDELGHVDDEIGALPVGIERRADLANTDAHDVIEPPVPVAVAEVKDGTDDLPSPGWVRTAYPCNSNMIVSPSSVSMTARKSVGTVPCRFGDTGSSRRGSDQ